MLIDGTVSRGIAATPFPCPIQPLTLLPAVVVLLGRGDGRLQPHVPAVPAPMTVRRPAAVPHQLPRVPLLARKVTHDPPALIDYVDWLSDCGEMDAGVGLSMKWKHRRATAPTSSRRLICFSVCSPPRCPTVRCHYYRCAWWRLNRHAPGDETGEAETDETDRPRLYQSQQRRPRLSPARNSPPQQQRMRSPVSMVGVGLLSNHGTQYRSSSE